MTAAVALSAEPTVFVVDDDHDLRHSLGMMLEGAGFRCELYPDGVAFLSSYGGDRAGCVVLDHAMPALNGLQVQQALRDSGHGIPVIFLTGHGTIPMAVEATRQGGMEFLEKPVDGDRLLECIRRALVQDAQRRMQNGDRTDAQAGYARLTAREREVLGAIIEGLTSKEIARRLGVSHRTVDIHRGHILHKMGAKSLAQLVQLAALATG